VKAVLPETSHMVPFHFSKLDIVVLKIIEFTSGETGLVPVVTVGSISPSERTSFPTFNLDIVIIF
jgi:hypothetical protein